MSHKKQDIENLRQSEAILAAVFFYAEGNEEKLRDVLKREQKFLKNSINLMQCASQSTTVECVKLMVEAGLKLEPSLEHPVDLYALKQNTTPAVFQEIIKHSPKLQKIHSPLIFVRIQKPTQEIIDAWERDRKENEVALFENTLIHKLKIKSPAAFLNCQIEESTIENAVIKEKFQIGYSKIRNSLIHSKGFTSICLASNIYQSATIGADTISCRFHDGILKKGEHTDVRFSSPGTYVDPTDGAVIRSIEKTNPSLTKILASVAGCDEESVPNLLGIREIKDDVSKTKKIETVIEISQFSTHIPLPGSATQFRLKAKTVRPPQEYRTILGAKIMEPCHRAYIIKMMIEQEKFGADVFRYMMKQNGSLIKSPEHLGPPPIFQEDEKYVMPRLFEEDKTQQEFRESIKKSLKDSLSQNYGASITP